MYDIKQKHNIKSDFQNIILLLLFYTLSSSPSKAVPYVQSISLSIKEFILLTGNEMPRLKYTVVKFLTVLFLFINGASVRVAARLNTVLSAAKTLALCVIILTGVVWLARGKTLQLYFVTLIGVILLAPGKTLAPYFIVLP